ncbi:MAG: hypothetical protein ACQES5_11160 [Thermodesulfobacteriota bacterium]
MSAQNKNKIAAALIVLSLAVFSSATYLGPIKKIDPFYTYYYLFAWWPFILTGEGALHFRNRSLLFAQPLRFLLLMPLSVCVWLIFECFNLRLENWHYINLPQNTAVRWTAYFFSFASVLPGLGMVKNLLSELGAANKMPRTKIDLRRHTQKMQLIGAIMLILPLAAPKYFFPLVWGGFIFLIDPYLYKRGAPSFTLNLAIGRWHEFIMWLYSGAVCGLLWELWNFQAGSKWFYTVPFVGDLKLFEMPVAGFLGFPPFAVECSVMASLFFYLEERAGNKPGHYKIAFAALTLAAAAVFCCSVFFLIDLHTVAAFK